MPELRGLVADLTRALAQRQRPGRTAGSIADVADVAARALLQQLAAAVPPDAAPVTPIVHR